MGSRLGMRRDPCAVCGLPVFLAEKLVVSRTLYHRTCFRCARCRNQLTFGNYYETEEGQYCCETCPDEESLTLPTMHQSYNKTIVQSSKDSRLQNPDDVYQKPLSDEEKSEQAGLPAIQDTGSPPASSRISSTSERTLHTQKMRLNFMASHLLSEKLNELSVVDGPETLFQSPASSDSEDSLEEHSVSPDSSPRSSPKRNESDVRRSDPINMLEVDGTSFGNKRLTAISFHDVDNKSLDLKENTKDLLSEAVANSLSLVQRRLKMFEGQEIDNVRACKGDSVEAASLKKDLKASEQKREEESLQSEDFEPKESLKSKEALESREIFESKEPLESRDSSEILKDVANSCEIVEPLSPTDKGVSVVDMPKKIMDNRDPQRSSVSTESNLFTAKGINLSDIEEYPEALNPFAGENEQIKKDQTNSSTNPFDSEEDEDPRQAASSPQPATRVTVVGKNTVEQVPVKRRLQAPHINLNPFLSDEDDESDTEAGDRTLPTGLPVPKPRTIKQTEIDLLPSKADLDRSGIYASNTSLGSCGSAATPGGTYRKKKPAPQPPTKEILSPNSNPATPIHANTSPRTIPRLRKTKPAPPPPLTTSTPQSQSLAMPLSFNESPIVEVEDESDICKLNMWEDQKSSKDEMNRNRQSLTCVDNPRFGSYRDKSVQGKWKRKKGPAPPRPIPHRRKIKVLSLKDVKLELDEIEMQQQGLEKQGVRLEQIIRDKSESDTSLGVDVEELVLELFALVNEKNELFRRQAELMLLRRQQRLEEEHADVEYQIRCLMCQPEATKTDFDKQREEALIQRLVQIVERRNEIVECLEMDRRREVEEDRSINKHMGLYAAKSKADLASDNDANRPSKIKKGKLKEKFKEKKPKKSHKKDADKDVDEAEVKLKRHRMRKWF